MVQERIIHTFAGQTHPVVQVCERGDIRFLRFGSEGGWQGAIRGNHPDRPVFAYQRAFRALLDAVPTVERFLSFGVGTGTALHHLKQRWPHAELYGVEIESCVIDAAIAYFQCPSHHEANYWVGDGVAFLCNVDLAFDLIFVDAYLSDHIYQPCLEPAFAQVLRAAVPAGGTVACNIITQFPMRSRVGAFVTEAARQFGLVLILPVGPPLPFAEQNALVVMTDDEKLAERWRSAIGGAPWLTWWERAWWPLRLRRQL